MGSSPASIGTELTLILLLILANGLFAMSEIALVSSRKARLNRLAAEGSKGAKAALELAKDPTQFLSAVQVGITLIGIVTGAYGGATLAQPLAAFLRTWPLLQPHGELLSMTVVVTAITYVSLVIGELVPKKIALNNPEALAVSVAIPMRWFAQAATPFVRLLSVSTEGSLRLLRVRPGANPPVTEEEIKLLIAEGTAYGTFEHAEKMLVERVFTFGDTRVHMLMTPRTRVEWLDLAENEAHNLAILQESDHSWLPVARGSLDDLAGIVKAREVFAHHCVSGRLHLDQQLREPLMVPKSMRAFRLLELFRQSGWHVAIVVDEFGGMAGLVSVHDILEQLVGELPQPNEGDERLITQREDGSWLIDGLLPAEEFKAHFGLVELPGEETEQYQTLGGFVTTYLGRIPRITDAVEYEGLRLEVVNMDRARVDKILVTAGGKPKTKESGQGGQR